MELSKTDNEHLNDFPHSELVIDNGTLTLRSIFDFTGGHDELFAFLYGCKKQNCTVVFKNEDLTVKPNDEDNDNIQSLVLSMYAWIAHFPKLANDYIQYLHDMSFNYGEAKRTITVIKSE